MPSGTRRPAAHTAGIYIYIYFNNLNTGANSKVEKVADSGALPELQEMKQRQTLKTLPGRPRASRITGRGKVSNEPGESKQNHFFPGMQNPG